MPRTLECFYPGRGFPSISTTGRSCALSCRHCGGRYLEGMVPVTEPEDLVIFAQALERGGGEGFLLSGGSDAGGKVSLGRFVPAIKEVKRTTSLRINAHVGLSPCDELEALVGSGVDAFSVDVYGDAPTISEVLGIRAKAEDYIAVVEQLLALGAPTVAPHICVGVRGGRLSGEMSAIEMLRPLSPGTLVLISFIPTRGTAFESCSPPRGEEVVSVVTAARSALPDTRLLLGCMRSRKDRSWEMDAVLAGIDGMVLPSEATVRAAESLGHSVVRKSVCCALG